MYKSLSVIESLVANGSDEVVEDLRSEVPRLLSPLERFQFVDLEGKDQGVNVRVKAAAVGVLLRDASKIGAARAKAAATRSKYGGISAEESRRAAGVAPPPEEEEDWRIPDASAPPASAQEDAAPAAVPKFRVQLAPVAAGTPARFAAPLPRLPDVASPPAPPPKPPPKPLPPVPGSAARPPPPPASAAQADLLSDLFSLDAPPPPPPPSLPRPPRPALGFDAFASPPPAAARSAQEVDLFALPAAAAFTTTPAPPPQRLAFPQPPSAGPGDAPFGRRVSAGAGAVVGVVGVVGGGGGLFGDASSAAPRSFSAHGSASFTLPPPSPAAPPAAPRPHSATAAAAPAASFPAAADPFAFMERVPSATLLGLPSSSSSALLQPQVSNASNASSSGGGRSLEDTLAASLAGLVAGPQDAVRGGGPALRAGAQW